MSRKRKLSAEVARKVVERYRYHRAALEQFNGAPYSKDLEDSFASVPYAEYRDYALLILLNSDSLDLLTPEEREEAHRYIAISRSCNHLEMSRATGDKTRPRRVVHTYLRDKDVFEYLQERACGKAGSLLRSAILNELKAREILPKKFTLQAFTKLIRRVNVEHFFKGRKDRIAPPRALRRGRPPKKYPPQS